MFNRDCLHSQSPSLNLIKDSRRLARLAVYFPTTRLTTKGLPVPDIVIQAENLGKKYTTGHQTERGGYVALRDVLVQNARAFWRTTADLLRGKPIILGNDLEEVWALKDVNFE
ncbi:MAG: hypothetical protein JXR84_12295 [Anaerolineae bacterium]|nr:hypothetical protein [Anaerolineae bacterium]